MSRAVRAGLVPLIALGLVLAGCGGRRSAGDRIDGSALTIYAGLPLQGPSSAGARSVLNAELLALEQHRSRVGRYRLTLRVMNDASPTRSGWDPGQTTVNVHQVAQDPLAVGYLGDFDSGASAIAIPVLGRVGIPQLSPTGTAVGLTSTGPGSVPGEPGKYYPTGQRTFVRLAPDDQVQAAVQIDVQRELGCRSTFVLDDGDFDGDDAAEAFAIEAHSRGLTVAGSQVFPVRAPDYRALAVAVAHSGANCVLISALPESGAARLAAQLAIAMPHGLIFGCAGLAQATFAAALPSAVQPRVTLTAPAPSIEPPNAAVRTFARAYRARFGDPGPFAAYGYEAMQLLLGAIGRATDGGTGPARRSRVLSALLSASVSGGPLGSFRVQPNGATTLRAYAVYGVHDGALTRESQFAQPPP